MAKTKIKIPSPVDILADPPAAEALNELRANAVARLAAVQRLRTGALAGAAAAGLALFALMLYGGAGVQAGEAIVQAAILAGVQAVAIAVLGYSAWYGCYAFLAPDTWTERVLHKLVNNLQLVTPETHPDECMALAYMCQTDPIVGAYRQKLVGMQRHFTVAEFRAARAWFGDAAVQKKVAAARAACAEMGMVYGPAGA